MRKTVVFAFENLQSIVARDANGGKLCRIKGIYHIGILVGIGVVAVGVQQQKFAARSFYINGVGHRKWRLRARLVHRPDVQPIGIVQQMPCMRKVSGLVLLPANTSHSVVVPVRLMPCKITLPNTAGRVGGA